MEFSFFVAIQITENIYGKYLQNFAIHSREINEFSFHIKKYTLDVKMGKVVSFDIDRSDSIAFSQPCVVLLSKILRKYIQLNIMQVPSVRTYT